MSHLIMPCKSLLPGVGLVTAHHLTPVHWLVCVALSMPFQVLLPGEGLITLSTVVHPLHLHPPAVHFQMLLRPIECNNLPILLCIKLVLSEGSHSLLLALHLLAGVTVVDNLATLSLRSTMLSSTLDIITMAVRSSRKGCVVRWSVGRMGGLGS